MMIIADQVTTVGIVDMIVSNETTTVVMTAKSTYTFTLPAITATTVAIKVVSDTAAGTCPVTSCIKRSAC